MRFNLKRMAPWGSFVLASGLLLWLLAHHWSHMTHPKPGDQPLGVFGTYWASGSAARHGSDPYVEYPPLTWKFHAFGKTGQSFVDLNLNPPSVLPVFSLVSRFSPLSGALTWAVLSTFLFIVSAAVLIRRYQPERKQVWWLLTCGATVMTLNLQQIYVVLLLLSIGAWLLLESEHEIAAGVLLGLLVAFKPNFAVWPLFLALTGRTRTILPASLTAAILSIIPVILYGPIVYAQWLRAVGINSHSMFPEDVSIAGNFTRIGSRSLGLVIAVALLMFLIYLVKATRPPLYEVTGIALCAALLCAPLGWMHYTLILAPILFAKRWSPVTRVAAGLLWINPAFIDPKPYPSHWSTFVRGLIYFIPMCMLLGESCRPSLQTLRARWQPSYALSPARDGQ